MKRIFGIFLLVLLSGLLFTPAAKGGAREDKLVEFAADGNVDGVRGLLDQGADVNAKQSEAGCTALGASIVFYDSAHAQDYINVVKLLLARGADVNAVAFLGGTPLTAAVQNGEADIVRILIEHKADVNKTNDVGDTALMVANSVLEKGILDVNDSAKKPSYRPLTAAEKATYTEIVRMLQAAGAK